MRYPVRRALLALHFCNAFVCPGTYQQFKVLSDDPVVLSLTVE